MSEQTDVSAVASDTVHTVMENAPKIPATQPAPSQIYTQAPRLFNRDKSVHQLLGGGRAADSLLWRNKYLSAGVLVGSTLIWFLLEKSGYTLITLFSNILIFVVVILFVWANVAALLNRSGPPLPELSLSEDFVLSTATALRLELNKALEIARDVALGKDFKLFLKVVAFLWVVSTVTQWFNFLTLLWIGIILSHIVPFVYDQYEDVINHHAVRATDMAKVHYKKLDETVFSKIPRAPAKEKKVL